VESSILIFKDLLALTAIHLSVAGSK